MSTNKCTTCEREFEGTEGFIADKPYCHPFDSTGPTCYSKALNIRPFFDQSEFFAKDGMGNVVLRVRRGE
jgi:hypothetical protein